MTAIVVYNTDLNPVAVIDLKEAMAYYLEVQGVVRLLPPPEEEEEEAVVCDANAVPDNMTLPVVELYKVHLSNDRYLVTTTAPAHLVQKLPSALLPGQDKYFRGKEEWEQ